MLLYTTNILSYRNKIIHKYKKKKLIIMAKKNLKRRKSINQTPSFTEQELIKFLQNQQPNSNKFGLGSQMTADSKAAVAENFGSAGNAVGAIGGMASGAMAIAGETKKLATVDTSADDASVQNVPIQTLQI